jgi:hypothetical protein
MPPHERSSGRIDRELGGRVLRVQLEWKFATAIDDAA